MPKSARARPLLLAVGDEIPVLRRVNGNRMAAARLLGINRRALYRRVERHHIDDEPARMSARRNCS